MGVDYDKQNYWLTLVVAHARQDNPKVLPGVKV